MLRMPRPAVGRMLSVGRFYVWGRGYNRLDPVGFGVRLMVWPAGPVGVALALNVLLGPVAAEAGVVLRWKKC